MFSRNLEKAREAYKTRDIELSKQVHNTEIIAQLDTEKRALESIDIPSSSVHKEMHKKGGEYIKSAVFGGMDGIITCFSVVTAAHGASLSSTVILILGIATMIGDAISMALGDYLSTKAEIEYQACEKKREEWEVENNPEGEKIEMVEIYRNRGLSEEDANLMATTISKSKKAWIEVMMVEELGLIEMDDSPGKNAIITFFSFLIFGIIPLLPYCANKNNDSMIFEISIGLTVLALIVLGFAKSCFVDSFWLKSCGETLCLGSLAAGSSYLIGWLLEPLAQ